MTAMLEIDGLYKAFGPVRAVNGITLSVGAGEVLDQNFGMAPSTLRHREQLTQPSV